MSSFHGTATSLQQKNASEKRNITSEFSKNIMLKVLSDHYIDVAAAYRRPKTIIPDAT